MNAYALPILPVELVYMALGFLESDSLVRTSHVSSAWRALSHAQPRFWRGVRLAALSRPAFEFFEARLSCNRSSPLDIHISLELHNADGPLPPRVLALLAENLYRTGILWVRTTPACADALMDCLRQCAAPRLEEFRLHYRHTAAVDGSMELAPPLPADLFAGASPRLQRLLLRDVPLPARAVIPVFGHVTEPTIESQVPQRIPARLLDHFPRAASLGLFGSCAGGPNDGTAARPTAPRRLDKLRLALQPPDFEPLLAAVPEIASVRSILCAQPDARLVDALTAHLPAQDALELELVVRAAAERRSADGVVLTVCYAAAVVRNFGFYQPQPVASWPLGALFAPCGTHAIATFTIHPALLPLVTARIVPALPRCRTLGIFCDKVPALDIDFRPPEEGAQLRAPDEPFLPNVTSIFVSAESSSCVDAGLLADLLTALLDPTLLGLPMHIRRHVTLTGDMDNLSRRFSIKHD